MMVEPRKVVLPSGATLVVAPAPFTTARRLFQAVTRELGYVEIRSADQVMQLTKNIYCGLHSSLEVEKFMSECFLRCTYDNAKIVLEETFEPADRRQDYTECFNEVLRENIAPFINRLSADLQRGLLMIGNIQLS